MQTIAIIGAGPAGLVAAEHLLAEGLEVVILERKAGAGGVWNTAPGNGYWPNPVYDGLLTNVPRTLMTFTNHSWPPNTPLFPRSDDVRAYLQSYATSLQSSESGSSRLTMRYNTEVIDLRRSTQNQTARWKIQTRQLLLGQDSRSQTDHFDGVVVAIGNYHKPSIPKYPNLQAWDETYPGVLSHSVSYRRPQDFARQNVLVVGNSASGWDISQQLAGVAKTVIVSSGRFDPNTATQRLSAPSHIGAPAIESFNPEDRSISFVDGQKVFGIDKIILCTGYEYDFSFIKKGNDLLFPTGIRVGNVYEHIFYTIEPSLAFIGLPKRTAAFTVAEAQSAVVAWAFGRRIGILSGTMRRRLEQQAVLQNGDPESIKDKDVEYCHSFQLRHDKKYVNRFCANALRR